MSRRLLWFVIAVAVQGLILAAVPGRKLYTLKTGRLITIKTAPVDPYDILSGYHVVLNYEISRPEGLGQLHRKRGQKVYVVLKEDPNQVWSAQSVHDSWPKEVPQDCVVIKGKKSWRGVDYGIAHYFIPEEHRGRVESDLRENSRQARAQIMIDQFGEAALVRLLVQDRVYEY